MCETGEVSLGIKLRSLSVSLFVHLGTYVLVSAVVFLSSLCVHGFSVSSVLCTCVCYTPDLKGVALLHLQSHVSVTTPLFSGDFIIVASGLR